MPEFQDNNDEEDIDNDNGNDNNVRYNDDNKNNKNPDDNDNNNKNNNRDNDNNKNNKANHSITNTYITEHVFHNIKGNLSLSTFVCCRYPTTVFHNICFTIHNVN